MDTPAAGALIEAASAGKAADVATLIARGANLEERDAVSAVALCRGGFSEQDVPAEPRRLTL